MGERAGRLPPGSSHTNVSDQSPDRFLAMTYATLLRPIALACLGSALLFAPVLAPSGPTRIAVAATPASADERVLERSRYVFGWNGIPAAVAEFTLSLEVHEGRPVLHFEGNARTTEQVDFLWTMRDSVMARTDARTFVPRRFELFRRENDTRLDTVIVHDERESKLRIERLKRGTLRKNSFPSRDLYDPISAMLMLRSDALSPGSSRKIRITEGKRIYELALRVLARERIRLNDESVPTLKISIRYEALDGSSSEEDGIRSTTLWVSDDDGHALLRMEAESPLGLFFGERVS